MNGIQKPVFVLGSAPGAEVPSDISRYFLIAANGAIAAFPDLVPDVLILNGYALVDNNGVGPETRAKLKGRSVKKLVVIDNLKPSSKSTASRVQELGIHYEYIEFWSKTERAAVCSNASNIQYEGLSGNVIPSTGVTAICYAISLSKDVLVSGISIETNGHSYSSEYFIRGHVEVDSQTLKAIAGKFHTYEAAAPVVLPEPVVFAIDRFDAYFRSANAVPPNARISVPTSEWQALRSLLATGGQAQAAIAQPTLTEELLAEKIRSHGVYGGLAAHLMPFITQHAAPQAQADERDAARWREALMHIGADHDDAYQQFVIRGLPIRVNLMQGSISQHFTKSIDEAIVKRQNQGEKA